MIHLPATFEVTISSVHGRAGKDWLLDLPRLISKFSADWQLELEAPFPALSYNLVIPGQRADGLAIVLKLGVPNPELTSEAEALRHFDGNGATRLLEAECESGALLIERIVPGESLAISPSPDPVEIATDTMRSIWREPPLQHNFRTLEDWFAAFERLRATFGGGTGPFDPAIIARAESTFRQLSATTTRRVVLHGDLHHDNILSSGTGRWTVIDPKGIIGDPAFEPSTFIHNQLPLASNDEIICGTIQGRITRFSELLNIPRQRIADWAFCQRVLSTLWSLEDACPWEAGWRLVTLMVER
jgi:streptomycin 6-kinase